MILLLGGTSDTAPLAEELAAAGLHVLVSTATDAELDVGSHPNISRRAGRLDRQGLIDLIREHGIAAIVDATHPYAATIRETASRVAQEVGVPYLTYLRPKSVSEQDDNVRFTAGHEEAAALAFSMDQTVLTTVGSNNLVPYVSQSTETGLPLYVRVLDREESTAACRRAGIPPRQIIAQRGPFSLEQNRRHIRQCGAGVLVTKDGGEPAGMHDKLEAARMEKCRIVLVERPLRQEGHAFDNFTELAREVVRLARQCSK